MCLFENLFAEYFDRAEKLEKNTATQFEKIENLIEFHFQFVKDMPDEIYLIVSTCPAKLNDPDHFCAENVQRQRKWLTFYRHRGFDDCPVQRPAAATQPAAVSRQRTEKGFNGFLQTEFG